LAFSAATAKIRFNNMLLHMIDFQGAEFAAAPKKDPARWRRWRRHRFRWHSACLAPMKLTGRPLQGLLVPRQRNRPLAGLQLTFQL
jgi:hypothetical protein